MARQENDVFSLNILVVGSLINNKRYQGDHSATEFKSGAALKDFKTPKESKSGSEPKPYLGYGMNDYIMKNALDVDAQPFFQEQAKISDLIRAGLITVDQGYGYLQQLAQKAITSSNELKSVTKHLDSSDTWTAPAMTADGIVAVRDKETGLFTTTTADKLDLNKQKVLTNAEIIQARTKDPTLAFNSDVFLFARGFVKSDDILKRMNNTITNLGHEDSGVAAIRQAWANGQIQQTDGGYSSTDPEIRSNLGNLAHYQQALQATLTPQDYLSLTVLAKMLNKDPNQFINTLINDVVLGKKVEETPGGSGSSGKGKGDGSLTEEGLAAAIANFMGTPTMISLGSGEGQLHIEGIQHQGLLDMENKPLDKSIDPKKHGVMVGGYMDLDTVLGVSSLATNHSGNVQFGFGVDGQPTKVQPADYDKLMVNTKNARQALLPVDHNGAVNEKAISALGKAETEFLKAGLQFTDDANQNLNIAAQRQAIYNKLGLLNYTNNGQIAYKRGYVKGFMILDGVTVSDDSHGIAAVTSGPSQAAGTVSKEWMRKAGLVKGTQADIDMVGQIRKGLKEAGRHSEGWWGAGWIPGTDAFTTAVKGQVFIELSEDKVTSGLANGQFYHSKMSINQFSDALNRGRAQQAAKSNVSLRSGF